MTEQHDDSDHIKRCAHCASDAFVKQAQDGGYFIECGNQICGVSTCLMYATGDDPVPLLMEKWNRRPAAAAPLYDTETPPVGLFALRDVVLCLRETGRFVDEEGEATNALEDLLDRLGVDNASLVSNEKEESAAALPVQQWQDISTAPKDGTEVWMFNGEQGRMHWTEGELDGDTWALWVWADKLLAEADPEPDQPTHWTALPPPPADQGEQQ